MRMIIAGSRTIPMDNIDILFGWISNCNFDITEVVSGGAAGADKIGEVWATMNHKPIKQFLPDWNKHGRSAGIIRNRKMGDYADALIAIWDGESGGTSHMIAYMRKIGKPVEIIEVGNSTGDIIHKEREQ
ncbi:MAG: DUF2493 domain-containing protein [Thermoplasmata archaeon]|nr:DUF2493 domain-containing protein [Thermoplasmata archaeon]